MRNLDGNLNLRRVDCATVCHQPCRHRGETFTTVLEYPLSKLFAVAIGEEHVMAFRGPVNASIPLFWLF